MTVRTPKAPRRRTLRWLLILALPTAVSAQAPDPGPAARDATVQGVLFYSPSCPHCRDVMTEGLPPILERFAPDLEIAGVNTATAGGQALFRAVIEALAIPPERVGVPTLIMGDRVLVGGYEIPALLPAIVEEGLAGDGIDWPRVPLLRRALAAQGLLAEETGTTRVAETEPEAGDASEGDRVAAADDDVDSAAADAAAVDSAAADADAGSGSGDHSEGPTAESPPGPGPRTDAVPDSVLAGAVTGGGRSAMAHQLTVGQRLILDPAGNATALAVLVLMVLALGLVAADRAGGVRMPEPPAWLIPALTGVGIVVAGYLTYVEATGAEAVCGPVGDCNTVQQSRYARILGVPVGVLGVFGYAVLLAMWAAGRTASGAAARRVRSGLWWLALGATLFSVYLTFLEPFVIGASCAWCLTSAVVTTAILLAATGWRRSVGVSPTPRPSVSH